MLLYFGLLLLVSAAQCQNVNARSFSRNPDSFRRPLRRFERPPPPAYLEMTPSESEVHARRVHPNSEPFIPGARPYTVRAAESLGQLPLSPRPQYDNFAFSPEAEDRTPVSDVALDGDDLLPLKSAPPPPGLQEDIPDEGRLSAPDAPYETDQSQALEVPEEKIEESAFDNDLYHNGDQEIDFSENHEVDIIGEEAEGRGSDGGHTEEGWEGGDQDEIFYEEYYEDEDDGMKSHKREVPDSFGGAGDFHPLQNAESDYLDKNSNSEDFESQEPASFSPPVYQPTPQQQQNSNHNEQRFRPQFFEGFNHGQQRHPPSPPSPSTPQKQHEETNQAYESQNRPNHHTRSPFQTQRHNIQPKEVNRPNFDRFKPKPFAQSNLHEPQVHESQSSGFQTPFLNERENAVQELEPVASLPTRIIGRPKFQGQAVKKRKRPFRNQGQFQDVDSSQSISHGSSKYPYEEEEEKEEEPDRLSILLQQTKFNCQQKKDGYYADEELNCEVFHFCQDKVKHSWLCPNGASFHQVHLICMPQSEDNICSKSSKFHFVNDYLYKETEESNDHKRRYMQRYYPEGYEEGIATLEERQVSPDQYEPNLQSFRASSTRRQNVDQGQKRPPSRQFQQSFSPDYDDDEIEHNERGKYEQNREHAPSFGSHPNNQQFSPQYNQEQFQRHDQELAPRPGASFLINEDQTAPAGRPQYF